MHTGAVLGTHQAQHGVNLELFFSSMTKTKIFIDENKLIFVTKTTTTTTKIRQFSSTKRKLKL